MVPIAMLKNRIIWSGAGNLFFVLSSILVADFYLAIYFQAVHDNTPFMSGVHMLPTTIGMVLFTMFSAIMSESRRQYLPITMDSCFFMDLADFTQLKSLATSSRGSSQELQ